MFKKIVAYWKSILVGSLICLILFLPGNKFPKQNLFQIEHLDKIIHAFLFLLLEWFLLYDGKVNMLQKRIRLVLISTSVAVAFGILTEVIQEYFIFERTGSLLDFFADLTGILIGIISYRLLARFINRSSLLKT
jgi:VanZ family protein